MESRPYSEVHTSWTAWEKYQVGSVLDGATVYVYTRPAGNISTNRQSQG